MEPALTLPMASRVEPAASETSRMLEAMADAPSPAEPTVAAISRAVLVCCSTASTMRPCTCAIRPMMSVIRPIASTAPRESPWIAPIFSLISPVAAAVCLASSLTSFATTAKPFPASPARAASIVALSASRLVCAAIDVIMSMTWPISALDSPSLATERFVAVATTTASSATPFASLAPSEISAIELDSAAAAPETSAMATPTPEATVEEFAAWPDVASAPVAISLFAAASSSEVEDNRDPTNTRGRMTERVIQMAESSTPMPKIAVSAAARFRAACFASWMDCSASRNACDVVSLTAANRARKDSNWPAKVS